MENVSQVGVFALRVVPNGVEATTAEGGGGALLFIGGQRLASAQRPHHRLTADVHKTPPLHCWRSFTRSKKENLDGWACWKELKRVDAVSVWVLGGFIWSFSQLWRETGFISDLGLINRECGCF